MAASELGSEAAGRSRGDAEQDAGVAEGREDRGRYRPLPTGSHGLDPELVRRDQGERLRQAMVELIAAKGYGAVRVADVARLARVSRPTFYSLYAGKEELLLGAYDEIAQRTARAVMAAYGGEGGHGERLLMGMRAFCELARDAPHAMSLQLFGAFGAGPQVMERRRRSLQALENGIRAGRDPRSAPARSLAVEEGAGTDLTVAFVLGGIREVSAARLQRGAEDQLPALAPQLAAWALSYPRSVPAGLAAPAPRRRRRRRAAPSLRARQAEGRLPSGRSEMPRELIVKSQRERIVDATAAIVAEQGLARLTVPAIARRANVSLETFYSNYESKHDAFLGAQKVGMHQALLITSSAYDAHREDWPRAVAAGLGALLAYLCSEPAHAHLSVVDTFAASPDAIEIRSDALAAFSRYLEPGVKMRGARDVPPVAAEAVAGGVWQVLHHYIEGGAIAELAAAEPQILYLALTPFLGADGAARAARGRALELSSARRA